MTGNSKAKYVGESARSGCERFGEHMDDAAKMKPGSHIFKHWSVQHGGEQLGTIYMLYFCH